MFGQNAYIAHLADRSECLVVDPGFDEQAILECIQQHGLTPTAILNTHGHADHIAGNQMMKQKWPDCPLVIGAGDAAKLTDPIQNLSRPFGFDIQSPSPDQTVQDGDVFEAAGIALDVLELPGHSAGHVIFLYKTSQPWLVFVGDVIFQGSVGRTDFPDGNTDQLIASIRNRLYAMPDDTQLLPGHGPTTTVGDEKRHNPFVRG
jgi:glyoxylase-like metal-dependent hydrolase (beta-lactamase superfamily II)